LRLHGILIALIARNVEPVLLEQSIMNMSPIRIVIAVFWWLSPRTK
jgi:hypothetical protein